MKRIEISARFKDSYGNESEDNFSLDFEDDFTDSAAMTYANDLVSEWFYDVADDYCMIIWKEMGGGYDTEYDFFFEDYINNCSLDWNYKKEKI